MLTLDSSLRIPNHVLFTLVDQEALLLNIQTNEYFGLEEVGYRIWELLKDGLSTRDVYRLLLDEYEIDPAQLEQDLLEILNQLLENGLVEIIQV